MASDPGFVQHVRDQLRNAGEIGYRKMFGEYALYMGEKVVALVCDNQLFLKPTAAGRALLSNPVEAPPYVGARPHFLLDEHLDEPDLISALFRATEAELPPPKPKKPKKPKAPKATKTRGSTGR